VSEPTITDGHDPQSVALNLGNPETIGDLTDYVGITLTSEQEKILRAECHRRYGQAWLFGIEPDGDLFRVVQLTVKPTSLITAGKGV
jgi:hypothetical protein